jgi:hypothetical protein
LQRPVDVNARGPIQALNDVGVVPDGPRQLESLCDTVARAERNRRGYRIVLGIIVEPRVRKPRSTSVAPVAADLNCIQQLRLSSFKRGAQANGSARQC